MEQVSQPCERHSIGWSAAATRRRDLNVDERNISTSKRLLRAAPRPSVSSLSLIDQLAVGNCNWENAYRSPRHAAELANHVAIRVAVARHLLRSADRTTPLGAPLPSALHRPCQRRLLLSCVHRPSDRASHPCGN